MEKLSYRELETMLADGRIVVPPGSTWRHYKGTSYTIDKIVLLEATNEVSVLYTSHEYPLISFVRPLSVWLERIEWKGQSVARFTKI